MADALSLVAEAFRPIRRKGTNIPYLSHLMQVAVWVAERGGTEEQILAALLHDYIEDIDGATEEGVAEQFGPNVARMVVALSDSTGSPKPPWKERKVAYLEHLAAEPPDVMRSDSAREGGNQLAVLVPEEVLNESGCRQPEWISMTSTPEPGVTRPEHSRATLDASSRVPAETIM